MKQFTLSLIMLFTACRALAAPAGIVTPDEMQTKNQWIKTHLLEPAFIESDSRPPEAAVLPVPGLDVYANNDPVIHSSKYFFC
ncbi:MAG: hypothetical protein JXA82_05550 [Sedimentisphaerales bacterium]|nr:hypothetical protein [Sedimentisphaerales bacterium]